MAREIKDRSLAILGLWGEYIFINPYDTFWETFYDSELGLYGLRLIDLKLLDIYGYEDKEKYSYVIGFFESEDEAFLFWDMLDEELLWCHFKQKSKLPYIDIQKFRKKFDDIKKNREKNQEGIFIVKERDIELIDVDDEEELY